MILKVYRFDPAKDVEGYFQEFNIPITEADRFTAMDALKYIFDNSDSSLSFYSHSICNHGICGRCMMEINGKPALACTYLLDENEVVIKPKKGEVIKDLVVR